MPQILPVLGLPLQAARQARQYRAGYMQSGPRFEAARFKATTANEAGQNPALLRRVPFLYR